MSDLQTTFRRLSDDEYDSFIPFHKWSGLKIFAVLILVAVCIRWITS
jgi:hypothetical protein